MRDIRLLTEPFNPGALIGPFTNANTMHRAQDKLASVGVETLPIKVRGE